MNHDEANRRIEALSKFADAIRSFSDLSETDNNGCRPRPGREQEWTEASARIDQFVMKAARSFSAAGIWVKHSPPGTHGSHPVDPASLWQVCFEPNSWYPLEDLQREINRAIGGLEDRRDDPPSRNQGVSLEGFSIGGWFGALLYTVVGGLIVLGIGYWLGWVG